MRGRTIIVLAASLLLAVPGSADAIDIAPRCFITGGGTVADDSFGGSARARRDSVVEGKWHHQSADGRRFAGDVEQLLCRRNGGHAPPPEVEFSIADWTGSGTFDGDDVTFTVNAQDHGEPNVSDSYRIVISDEDDNIIYTEGGIIESGNFQIHASNPGHP